MQEEDLETSTSTFADTAIYDFMLSFNQGFANRYLGFVKNVEENELTCPCSF